MPAPTLPPRRDDEQRIKERLMPHGLTSGLTTAAMEELEMPKLRRRFESDAQSDLSLVSHTGRNGQRIDAPVTWMPNRPGGNPVPVMELAGNYYTAADLRDLIETLGVAARRMQEDYERVYDQHQKPARRAVAA